MKYQANTRLRGVEGLHKELLRRAKSVKNVSRSSMNKILLQVLNLVWYAWKHFRSFWNNKEINKKLLRIFINHHFHFNYSGLQNWAFFPPWKNSKQFFICQNNIVSMCSVLHRYFEKNYLKIAQLCPNSNTITFLDWFMASEIRNKTRKQDYKLANKSGVLIKHINSVTVKTVCMLSCYDIFSNLWGVSLRAEL